MNERLENRYSPDRVSIPGETLSELLDEIAMSQAELSRRTGRPKKTINEIIQGKASITPDTALQFEKVLGVPAHFWTRRQYQYDQHLAELKERETLLTQVDWLEKFPINDMVKLKWIEKHPDKVSQLQELLRFFGIASPDQWQPITQAYSARFRLSNTFESEEEHLSAWLRMGEIIGTMQTCAPYNQQRFRDLLASECRELTNEVPQGFVKDLKRLCSEAGVVVAFIPQLPKARVHGATRWISQDKALIQLSLRYRKDDQLWFSFFHEAAHILLHGKRDVFLHEGEAEKDPEGQKEIEASKLAANILIPQEELDTFLDSIPPGRVPSRREIKAFAKRIGVSTGIVVGRLQHDKLPASSPVQYSHFHDLKMTFKWAVD